MTVKGRKGDVVVDRGRIHPRPDTSTETLAKLRPAFSKDGTVTAGNASGINDGAAALVVMSAAEAASAAASRRWRASPPWRPPASIPRSWAPARSPPAARRCRRPAGRRHLDLIEANEAFAAQACAVNKDLGWDPAKVNVNGGAIALGHPIGACGARVLNTLLFEMQRRDAKQGPGDAVHRRRHGRRHVPRTRLIQARLSSPAAPSGAAGPRRVSRNARRGSPPAPCRSTGSPPCRAGSAASRRSRGWRRSPAA